MRCCVGVGVVLSAGGIVDVVDAVSVGGGGVGGVNLGSVDSINMIDVVSVGGFGLSISHLRRLKCLKVLDHLTQNVGYRELIRLNVVTLLAVGCYNKHPFEGAKNVINPFTFWICQQPLFC